MDRDGHMDNQTHGQRWMVKNIDKDGQIDNASWIPKFPPRGVVLPEVTTAMDACWLQLCNKLLTLSYQVATILGWHGGSNATWYHNHLNKKYWPFHLYFYEIYANHDPMGGLSDHYLSPCCVPSATGFRLVIHHCDVEWWLEKNTTDYWTTDYWTQDANGWQVGSLESTWPYCWKRICSWSWKSYSFSVLAMQDYDCLVWTRG